MDIQGFPWIAMGSHNFCIIKLSTAQQLTPWTMLKWLFTENSILSMFSVTVFDETLWHRCATNTWPFFNPRFGKQRRIVWFVFGWGLAGIITKPEYTKNWAPVSEPGFWDFQISDSRDYSFCKICSRNMLVRYRGIDNKGVLERPWTKWLDLIAISSTLKCQFTVKCWKVDFPMPCKTRSCQSSREKFRMVRALPPDTPRPPQFQLELPKKCFCEKIDFHFFPNSLLGSCPPVRWSNPRSWQLRGFDHRIGGAMLDSEFKKKEKL